MSSNEQTPSPRNSKRLTSTLIRWGICLLAVIWIARSTDWHQVRAGLVQANWGLALIWLAIFGPAPFLISLRLKWLLAVHDIRPSFRQIVRATFAGNFVMQSLPIGAGGGDTLKSIYVARLTPKKHEAVTSVFFDRFIGVAGLLFLSGIVVLANWRNPAFERSGRAIGLAVLVFVIGGAVFYSIRLRRVFHLDQIVALLPLSAHIQRIDRALFSFRHHRGNLLAAMGITLILHIVSITSVFFIGWALDVIGEGSAAKAFPAYLGYTPVCFLGGALPLGGMEILFETFFARVAKLGSKEQTLLLSLLGVRMLQLIWALPGGLIVLRAQPETPQEQAMLEDPTAMSQEARTQ